MPETLDGLTGVIGIVLVSSFDEDFITYSFIGGFGHLVAGFGGRVLAGQCCNIFTDHIEFQVDFCAGVYGLDICVFEGIGDDGDVKSCFFYIKYGEAGAVEADRAFFDHEVAELFWEFEAEFPAAVEFAAVEAGGGGIDMPLDDMAVEAAVHDQASFEVDEIAWLPVAHGGFFQGLFDRSYAVAAVFELFYGKADAVMGDTLVNFEFPGEGGFDPECFVGTFAVDGADLAEGFDDSGKHRGKFREIFCKGFQISGNWSIFAALKEV
jgi:hypothetical protein